MPRKLRFLGLVLALLLAAVSIHAAFQFSKRVLDNIERRVAKAACADQWYETKGSWTCYEGQRLPYYP